jgi:phosphoenolpyruvate-protein phosphotransferase
VVVSHSLRLAEAAVELALEMVSGEKPAIAIAAGAGEGVTGTNALKVAEAIATVSSPDGVLVMMDLGSAVLSAEMALEFIDVTDVDVRLTGAPLVEGLIAALVRAAAGATLDEVELEARGALLAKESQLGQFNPSAPPQAPLDPDDLEDEVGLRNPDGLHARPVAMLVAALAGFQARVMLANRRTGAGPADATSPTALLALGGREGDVIDVRASGPDAARALKVISELARDGFGEMGDAGAAPPTTPSVRGPMGVSPGRAVGPVVHMPEPLSEPPPGPAVPAERRADEADRIGDSMTAVESWLRLRAQSVPAEARQILDATATFAADPTVLRDARDLVTSTGESAERAVWSTVTRLASQLEELGGRMAERVADLHDLRDRVVCELLGRPAPGVPERTEPFILLAHDLAPADTAALDPALCLALVTEEGGPTSHTAILARALGLPAVVSATGAMGIAEGVIVLVDGTTGSITVDPAPELIADVASQPEPTTFSGRGGTADGRRVQLLANVASLDSVVSATDANSEGVGLFRTEFCFLDRDEAPTIEEQVSAYRPVLAAFPDRKVIIRTLDAGADKPLAFVLMKDEINPALGIRGVRTSWRSPELLDDQLRAIARAAGAERAQVGVMAPMVSTVEEAADFARRCSEYGLEHVGVMIETPAAALTAQEILGAVDFVSLGTNDLTQYAMAADRLVGDLSSLNDPWQPAVLRLAAMTGEAGLATGKPVGVCGEAAADPLLAIVLVGMGVSSLSMSPRSLAGVADRLGRVTFAQCEEAARRALAAVSAHDARAAVLAYFAS